MNKNNKKDSEVYDENISKENLGIFNEVMENENLFENNIPSEQQSSCLENARIIDLQINRENRRVKNESEILNTLIIQKPSIKESFEKGMEYGNYYAGIYISLLKAGMSIDDASKFVLDKSVYDLSIKLEGQKSKEDIDENML